MNRINAQYPKVSTRAPTSDEDLSTAIPYLPDLNSTKRERWKRGEREEENEREEDESHTFPPRTPIYNGAWPIICLSKNTRIDI